MRAPMHLPDIKTPWLRATYRGYYAPELGRLCCVFFGCWVGSSWDSADDAQRRLGPWQPQRHVTGQIDIGTVEVWS